MPSSIAAVTSRLDEETSSYREEYRELRKWFVADEHASVNTLVVAPREESSSGT